MSAGNGNCRFDSNSFIPPAALEQKRVQQLKSNDRRSNKNKRKTSDVGSKDDDWNAGSNKVNDGPGLRRRVREREKKQIIVYFLKTVGGKLPAADASAHPLIFLSGWHWSGDVCWRPAVGTLFVKDGPSRGTHRIPATHVLQQLAAHPLAASHLISRVNKGSRTRWRLL